MREKIVDLCALPLFPRGAGSRFDREQIDDGDKRVLHRWLAKRHRLRAEGRLQHLRF
ncbi:MAG: hypothetical protein HYS63_03755 [Methylocystis sp.]|nr:hypothetical protein [Methylocystis sp.]